MSMRKRCLVTTAWNGPLKTLRDWPWRILRGSTPLTREMSSHVIECLAAMVLMRSPLSTLYTPPQGSSGNLRLEKTIVLFRSISRCRAASASDSLRRPEASASLAICRAASRSPESALAFASASEAVETWMLGTAAARLARVVVSDDVVPDWFGADVSLACGGGLVSPDSVESLACRSAGLAVAADETFSVGVCVTSVLESSLGAAGCSTLAAGCVVTFCFAAGDLLADDTSSTDAT